MNTESENMSEQTPLLSAVNRSGYPLQVAIAHAVKAGGSSHGWRVLYEEQSWRQGDREGFVDIVLEHDNLQVVLVIECKRPQNAEWILLPPRGNAQLRRYARGLRVEWNDGKLKQNFPMWSDEPLDPCTPEAIFCVMPKDSGNLTLDRVGSEIITATEALEKQERGYLSRRGGDARRIYFAAIVTTAQLTVCSFDPGSISLADGTIPAEANFSRVDAVRLTKQLSTDPTDTVSYGQYGEEAGALVRAKERTVFIINADKLDNFLNAFEVNDRNKRG
jgi:hypothetical protein